MTRDELIEELNRDLSLEYTAIVQYTQHFGVLRGAPFMAVRQRLAAHARDELGHALTLTEQIRHLGGTPTVRLLRVKTSPEAVAMLEQDLTGERTAISRYRQRIRQAEELGLYDLGQKLREILAMEQDHLRDLEEALD